MLVLQQKPQDALQNAQEVLSAAPNNEDALEARGDGFRLLGRPDEAKKDYEKLCELRPQNGEYWHRLGMIESIQGNSAPALTHLRKAVELKPDLVAAINDIIYLLLKAGQTDAALAELDHLSKLPHFRT